MRTKTLWLLLASLALPSCDADPPSKRGPSGGQVSGALVDFAVPTAAAEVQAPQPIRVETLSFDNGLETFVLRGSRGPDRIVFLHGMCGHGKGYLESFQRTAAAHGIAIAPNGDKPCTGDGRTWSRDIAQIQAHIDDSFAAAGTKAPRGITIIGYSLGASRAEALVRKYPDRYDALISMAAPSEPSPNGLGHLRAAAMMAGTRERQAHMRAAAKSFERDGIPARFFELPGAAHGQMGDDPERSMAEALDWVESQPVE